MLANLAHPGETLATPRPGGMPAPAIPEYLRLNYWWAYIHPAAVKLFERGWLVDLILWGNYRQLSTAALAGRFGLKFGYDTTGLSDFVNRRTAAALAGVMLPSSKVSDTPLGAVGS